MAEPTTAAAPKRKRTRRNFAKEIADLRTYCKVNVEVLKGLTSKDRAPGEVYEISIIGKIEAYENVLKRLGAE